MILRCSTCGGSMLLEDRVLTCLLCGHRVELDLPTARDLGYRAELAAIKAGDLPEPYRGAGRPRGVRGGGQDARAKGGKG